MNAKKAKALRRIARNATTAMKQVEYKPLVQTIVSNGPVPIPGKDYAIHLGQVEMAPDCTRAVYQKLKKAAKQVQASVIEKFSKPIDLRLAA